MKSDLEKIHHIRPAFNRLFSPVLFVAGALVTLLLLILPYSGRLALAFVINVFFNRPFVYLNYASRWIARPLHFAHLAAFYFLIFGLFAIPHRWFNRKNLRTAWTKPFPENTTPLTKEFQS